MNVVVVGLGSIGRRHLASLRRCHPEAHVTVWHTQRSLADVAADPHGHRAVHSLADAIATKPEAALVAGPASLHVETGLEFARRGVHLFIEKPLADDLDGIDELLDTCRTHHLVLMVGYCFRFYRPLQALREAVCAGRIGRVLSIRAEAGQYLPDWRPGTDYRRGVSARRELGGGALLELSHELDYIRWIAGEVASVSARLARISDLDIDVEDVADLILEFASGALGSVHVDLVQRAAHRECRVVGTTGTLLWDHSTHAVRLYTAESGTWTNLQPSDSEAFDNMYRAQLSGFLDAANGRGAHAGATGADGRRVLELVAAARRSSETGCVVKV